MKTLLFLATTMAATGLAGCATTDRTATTYPPSSSPHGVKIDTDSEYIARVEEIARRRGVTVQWVHPPSRRIRSE